jgi:hypothetical protein
LRAYVSKGTVLLASLLVVPATIPDQRVPQSRYLGDERLVRIEKFFRDRNCPAADLAEEFLVAADRHHLDWRLLPAISFVESGGGKQYTGNNIMGWGSSRSSFPTIRSGIHHVATQLANSKYYKGKTLRGKLRTYNPRPVYTRVTLRVMRAFGPEDLLAVGPAFR